MMGLRAAKQNVRVEQEPVESYIAHDLRTPSRDGIRSLGEQVGFSDEPQC